MKRVALISVCLLVLLAGCSATTGPETSTVSETTVSGTEVTEENESFSADVSKSISGCGVGCRQVNFSVDLTYTGEEDQIRYPDVEMSVYVLDEGLTGWGEPERKVIWSDTEFPENITADEPVSFEKSFQVGTGDGVDIVLFGDCVVYGEVAVDYSDENWNKTEKFEIEMDQCEN